MKKKEEKKGSKRFRMTGDGGNTYPFDLQQKRLANGDIGSRNALDGNYSTLLKNQSKRGIKNQS